MEIPQGKTREEPCDNNKYRKVILEQIEHLKKLGLIITDERKAFEILSDIGLYRLGFYMFPFEKKYPAKVGRDHVFREGITLDMVIRLYYFDFELRHILLKYISRIEVHLRTSIVNYMSAKHHNNDTWFVDERIISKNYCRAFDTIYDRVRLSPYIKWHHHNHPCKYAPACKTLEFMTLSEIINLFSAIINIKDRLSICYHFGIRSVNTFNSYLQALRRIRNRCAHGGILYDYTASKRLVAGGPVIFSNVYERFNLKGSICVISYLLGKVSAHRKEQMDNELQNLIDKCKDNNPLYTAICIASGLN